MIRKDYIYLFLKFLNKKEVANLLYCDEVTLLLKKCKKKLSLDIKKKVSFDSVHNKNTVSVLLHSMTSLNSSMGSKDILKDSFICSSGVLMTEAGLSTDKPLPSGVMGSRNVPSHKGGISNFKYLLKNFVGEFNGCASIAQYFMAVSTVCLFIWSISKIPVRLLMIKLIRRIIQKSFVY